MVMSHKESQNMMSVQASKLSTDFLVILNPSKPMF